MTAPEENDFAVENSGGKPGRSGPPGNSNAEGNPGGGAPPANQNAASHHLHADPDNVLQYLEKEEPEAFEWVDRKYRDYLDNASFDAGTAKADKLLETVVCEYSIWKARGIQVKEGLVKKTHQRGADGDFYEIEAERPENQAVNRMDRQVMSKLDKLGIFDGQDSSMSKDDFSNEYYAVEWVDVEDGAVEEEDDQIDSE